MSNAEAELGLVGAPRLEFAFEVRLRFDPPQLVKCKQLGRERAGVFVTHGEIDGPRLKGTVIGASGGDYAEMRPDGVLQLDARYFLRAEDGTAIYLQSQGFRWTPLPAAATESSADPEDAVYMRVATRFEAPEGPHEWLARHLFVGVGRRTNGGNVIRYYQVL